MKIRERACARKTGLAVLILAILWVASMKALAFNGPASGQSAGTGNGAIGVGSNNDISVGTSTADSATKLLVVASSTGDTSSFSFKVLDSAQNPLFIIRNDGSVGIGTATLGTGLLDVGGLIYSNQGFTGSLSAANVSAGTFGSNTGDGNYDFPGTLTTARQILVNSSGGGYTWQNGSGSSEYQMILANSNADLELYNMTGSGAPSIYVQGSTNYVGIGTTNPLYTLDVQSSNEATDSSGLGILARFLQADSPGHGAAISVLRGTAGTWLGFDNNTVSYLAASSKLRIITGGTNESMDILSNGNVGIGTTGPENALEVGGNGQAIQVDYTTGANYAGEFRWAGLQLGNNGENRIVAGRTTAGGSLYFYTNNTNDAANYSVTPDGNLALEINASGSAQFYQNLGVSGNLSVTGTFSGSALTGTLSAGNVSAGTFGTNTGSGAYTFPGTLTVTGATNFNDAGATTGAPNLFSSGTGVLDAMFGSGSTSGFTADQSGGAVRFNGAGVNWGDVAYFPNGGGNGNQGNFRFMLSGSVLGSTPNAEVGVGSLYSAGDVGIGTMSPGAALDVNGTGVFRTSAGGGHYTAISGNYNSPILTTTDGSSVNSPPGYLNGGYAYDSMSMSANSYDMVGSGHWSTPALSGSPSWAVGINSCGSACGGAGDNFSITRAPATSGTPSFATLLYINSSGDVGVGTSSPSSLFTVAGNANITGTLTAGTFTGILNAGNVSAGTFGANTGGGSYTFPSTLTVFPAEVAFTNEGQGDIIFNSAGTYWGNISNPSSQVWALGYSTGGVSVGTPVLSWNASGNVGIGTSSPAYNLDIAGDVGIGTASGTSPSSLFFRSNQGGGRTGYVSSWGVGGDSNSGLVLTGYNDITLSSNSGTGDLIIGLHPSYGGPYAMSGSCTSGGFSAGGGNGGGFLYNASSGAASSCTVDFRSTWDLGAPVCILSTSYFNSAYPLRTSVYVESISATSLTVSSANGDLGPNQEIYFQCFDP